MAQLNKADLEQMGEEYFRSLEPESLVEVAKNLHSLAVEQLEKLELSSKTSSRPPSSDNPYRKDSSRESATGSKKLLSKESSTPEKSSESRKKKESTDQQKVQPKGFGQPKAGKQPGAKGKWRNQPLKAERIIEHYPQHCAACNASLENSHRDEKPYMGYYQLELVRQKSGLRVECVLHHYYGATCNCTHRSQAAPMEGELSEVVGRKSLGRIITPEFSGWLISDGYGAYRWVEHRQRCLAHLIRKALALTQAVVMEVRQLGQWLLDELRELIHARTCGESPELLLNARRRLQQVALLARGSEHPKLKALAKEILVDWDAVVAFVENPELPVTNNHAERALRHAVIARRIGYGTRSDEGTSAYGMLLSVIETCRLRDFNPWTYLGEVIATRRKGMSAPLIPQTLPVATSSPV